MSLAGAGLALLLGRGGALDRHIGHFYFIRIRHGKAHLLRSVEYDLALMQQKACRFLNHGGHATEGAL